MLFLINKNRGSKNDLQDNELAILFAILQLQVDNVVALTMI